VALKMLRQSTKTTRIAALRVCLCVIMSAPCRRWFVMFPGDSHFLGILKDGYGVRGLRAEINELGS